MHGGTERELEGDWEEICALKRRDLMPKELLIYLSYS